MVQNYVGQNIYFVSRACGTITILLTSHCHSKKLSTIASMLFRIVVWYGIRKPRNFINQMCFYCLYPQIFTTCQTYQTPYNISLSLICVETHFTPNDTNYISLSLSFLPPLSPFSFFFFFFFFRY
uniref:Uncharacterized protein n=1 Tax=Cacopsylla melanoneura TaxID=428564 RepID=A0A8D8YQW8_9HEMI